MKSLAESCALALLDAWNKRDLDAFKNLLTEDVVWYDPSMSHPPAVGRTAVMAFSRSVLTAFPDFSYSIRSPICVSADGKSCAIPWHITATQAAPFGPGFVPTGRQISVDGIDLVFVTDNLVSRIETFFDALSAADDTFGIKLRPRSGSLSENLLVRFQQFRAAWLRRQAKKISQQQ